MNRSWTHPMCEECWDERNSDRSPYAVLDADLEMCCWCGRETQSGIYVREDPERLRCLGAHEQ